MIKKLYILLFFTSLIISSETETFLDNGIGVNSTSMGQAYFNIVDVESAFYNPALLSDIQKNQIKLVLNKNIENIDELYFASGISNNILDIGVTYFRSQLKDEIKETKVNEEGIYLTGEKHSYFTSMLMLTLSKYFIPFKSNVGINLKQYCKNLSKTQGTCYSIDVGISKYILNKSVNLSATIRNPASSGYTWQTETEKPDLEYILGVGLDISSLKINLGSIINKNSNKLLFGLEWNHLNTLFCRTGYNKNLLSGGISINLFDVSFDYCYNHPLEVKDIIESYHKFGISFKF